MKKTLYETPQIIAETNCLCTGILCASADNLNYRDDWNTIFTNAE